MFVAAYWFQRAEPRTSAAGRIATFLEAIRLHSDEFARWYGKARSRASALRTPLAPDAHSLANRLEYSHRDADRQPMLDLGFSFSAWNGRNASISVKIGGWAERLRNVVVLDIDDEARLDIRTYRNLLDAMIRAFDPEYAVVARDGDMRRMGASAPWQVGLFTFARGGEVQQHDVG